MRRVTGGLLLKKDDGYVLDHDFAFPNRPGAIDRFELHLALDPVWQPQTEVRQVYTAFGLEPGNRFVLTTRYAARARRLLRDAPSQFEIIQVAPLTPAEIRAICGMAMKAITASSEDT